MKVRRDDFPNDPCISSMAFLKDRIEVFFKKHVPHSTQRYYPELDIYSNQIFNSNEILDIILFGNNVKSFFQSGLWPCRHYRIWTLSNAHKNFWANILFENTYESPINLIPRIFLTNELETQKYSKLPTQEDTPIDLVFSGRLSAQKNITYLLLLYKELELLNLNIRLHLYGSFDDQYDEIFGRRSQENYKENVMSLIQSLGFNNPPIINENLSKTQWTETSLQRPVLISLSTYHGEDFGVSITQAQEKGWPLIITDMLGHQCISHSNVIKIPSRYHLREHLPIDVKRIFAKDLARFLHQGRFSSSKCPNVQPSMIELTDIDLLNARKKLIQKMGTQLSLINAENVGLFYDTQVGLRLHLDFLNEVYSNKSLYVFIVEDADNKAVPHNIKSKISTLLKTDNFYPYFISLKHLFKSKVELELLGNAKKIILLLNPSIQEITVKTLTDILGFSKDLFY